MFRINWSEEELEILSRALQKDATVWLSAADKAKKENNPTDHSEFHYMAAQSLDLKSRIDRILHKRKKDDSK
jgi:hypothetical protein